jgi:diguanylate cyclase (GGDEF)-like protein
MYRMGSLTPGPTAADGMVDPTAMLIEAITRMPYGVSVWNGDYRLVFWNDAYLRLYGTPAEDVAPGMTLRDMLALSCRGRDVEPDRFRMIVERHERRLEGTADPRHPTVHVDRVGDLIVERTYLAIPGLGWVVIHEDETAQLRREADLRAQHSRIDLALDSMDYGFSLFDGDFTLTLWNDRFVDLYGLPAREIVTGMSLEEVLLVSQSAGNPLVGTAAATAAFEQARLAPLAEGETLQSETMLASGRMVRVRWKRTQGGWWVVTHQDVTEEHDHLQALERRELELARQNARFFAAVDHMTQGLCMFDERQELIICNERYARIYNLPPELARPGARLIDIWKHLDFDPPGGVEAYLRARLGSLAVGDLPETLALPDGRQIAVIHRPLADGGWVATHEDVTEQRRSQARISHLARHDELTGLPNRLLFREKMREAEAQIARGDPVAVLFIDLDHFKGVNDLFGHAIGDAALQQMAQRLLASCREGDVVSRLGGDEFAILQTGLSAPQDAAALAERIVRAVSAPLRIHGHEIAMGASLGIALAPDDGRDAETLIRHADLAAYRAKEDGRGAYHFFEHGMDAALQERLSFEMELRGALARSEFALVFQPLINLSTNRISSVEALLRWNHPSRGQVAPDRVIPAAERSGVIGPIGEWVLREACMTAAEWPKDVSVAVNVSPLQFSRRGLIRHIEDALALSGLEPGRLDIELTETALLANNEVTHAALRELRRIGVRISLDDFGTGYSSLGYLRSFAFDKIKIDRSFVQDLDEPGHTPAIIKAVIGLGRSLGLTTTAEGVETDSQFEFVRDEGCSEVQGYIFSPPLPAPAIAEKLARQGAPLAEAGTRPS